MSAHDGEHPSVNGGYCGYCGELVDGEAHAAVVDRAVSLLVNAARVSPELRQSMLIVEQELARLRDATDAIAVEAIGLRLVLRAVWDECEDFVGFDPVRDAVKVALDIREFTAEARP